ncbi:TetR/AcrR family transcriptional regulator [Nesterenkonia alba]|uniref:TetR/AcrR family transcriptional regulator n=1 Tax=Nesterenkonia alba TaxID=515814 RepID=UPI0003B60D15|nr:TetR/AcrR family transcriptional regulator [Nesterenkonia alba]
MRASKRNDILEAAKRVVQRDGVTALSYEAVASESGLTKGGLLYHFPSRDALLRGLHEHVAGQWEQHMVEEAGGGPEDCDAATRFAAYTRASQNPDRAELLLMLEASEDPETYAIWDEIFLRWGVQPPAAGAEEEQVRQFIARLAADGLWFYEALGTDPLDPQLRERVVTAITRLGATDSPH